MNSWMGWQRPPHWPCHYRAIHTSHERYPADNHGQHRSGRNVHHSLPRPGSDPARTGFGSRGSVGRGLYRPCRARPADRSLVAEDGAPEASATGRTGTPMLTRLLTGRTATPWDERVQDRTTLLRQPSSKAQERSGKHREHTA